PIPARRARGRAWERAPAWRCRAPSARARRGSPCNRRRASRFRPRALAAGELRRRAARGGVVRIGLENVLDLRECLLALDDPRRPVTPLLPQEVAQGARLLDVLGDMRRKRRWDLAVLRE